MSYRGRLVGETIREVVLGQKCTGCGTCAVACRKGAISIVLDTRKGLYLPIIDKDKCTYCGLCKQVCPGITLGDKVLREGFIDQESPIPLLGEYSKCYIGHSTIKEIRYNSASGGLVTQLLILALEEGIIDGALVTRMKREVPWEPEPFIARTKDEMVEASTSKYCPVPANVALRTILNAGEGSFAVVGLPCHLLGISQLEKIYPQLKDRIVLRFGLFCSHTDSFHGTSFLFARLGIDPERLVHLKYRGDGWPGGVNIKLESGTTSSVPLGTLLWRMFHDSLLFAPSACLYCSDVTCEEADISFGDAWLREVIAHENAGESVVITRSERGEDLLRIAQDKGMVEVAPLKPWDVVRSQRIFLHFKKVNICARGVRVSNELPCSVGNSIANWIVRIGHWMGSSVLGRWFLKRLPLTVIEIYFRVFYKVYLGVVDSDFDRLTRGMDR